MTTPSASRDGKGWPAYYTVVLLLFAAVFISYIDRTNISVAAVAMQDQLGWNETRKGTVLSSFFVGYILMMAASGALANRYGGRLVLGIAVIWWSLFTMLTPFAALVSFPALIAARIALGLGEAAVFPASINMVGRWVPPHFRSRATAIFASALSFGTLFSLPVTGWLVKSYGWHMPFYLFGAAGLVWAVVWFLKIGAGRGPEATEMPAHAAHSIPWGRLLGAPSVWAIVVGHFCANWMLYLLLAWMPSYFKTTFHVSLSDAGLMSAAPWLVSFISANVAGTAADKMLRNGVSAGFVRKLMMSVALLGGALCFWLLPSATTPQAAVLLMCCATGAFGCSLAGFAPNGFDIAPKYADVIWGISNTVGTLPGIFGVFITGWLVDRTGSYAAPFLLTAGLSVCGGIFYLVFGSGERQIE
jgi:ACS family sodium-dependent inorganic phosphate cotransporter